MPFALGTAKTIDGIANSYEITGSGNLDELFAIITGISGVSATNNNHAYTLDGGGTNRIFAISGTLLEDRLGMREVTIRNSAHICWSYGAGTTTFGKKEADGRYFSGVRVTYAPNAASLGGDVFQSAQGRCCIGAGTFNGVFGGVQYQQTGSMHFDIWDGVTAVNLDAFYMVFTGNNVAHQWKAGKVTTTERTYFVYPSERAMEGNAAVRRVGSFSINTGFRWLSPQSGNILRLENPLYSATDSNNSNAASVTKVINPIARYSPPISAAFNTYSGVKEVFRTINARYTNELGGEFATAPKIVILKADNSLYAHNYETDGITYSFAGTATFSGASASVEVLQSTRASGVSHNASGAGFTDEGSYKVYFVGYGVANQFAAVNVGTAYDSAKPSNGISLTANKAISPLVKTAYASVVTAPFAFSKTGNGTLTVSASATTNQAAEYLLKLAYDEATDAFWLGLNHTPAALKDGVIDFGAISIVVSGGEVSVGELSGTPIKTTGTVSKAGTGSLGTLLFSDSSGVKIVVTGLNPSGFTLDANNPASVMTRKVGTTTWTRTSTTGTSVAVSADANADYQVRIRVPGYEWQERTVNSGASGLSIGAALVVTSDLGGSAIFSKTTDPAQTGAIAYNATTQRIEITNTGSSELAIDFTNAYVKFQQILHSPTLVALWENQIQTNTTKNGFVIPDGNQTNVYLSTNSTSGAYLSFSVKYPDASDARDRFHGTTAGQIQFATSVTTLTVAVPTASENAIAVRTNLATELGRIDAAVSTRSTYAGLTTAQAQVLTDLDSMTTGAGSAAKFTAAALENAPASTGGGTGGGSGLTATQSAQLATLHNTLVAHKFDLSAAVAEGATSLPIDASFDAGYFDGHYVVINDGSGSPIQRSISSHTKLPMPGAPGTLTLNAPIPAIAAGQTVNILIRTTTQDGAQAGDAMTLTSAERTAVADEVQSSIIDEDDGKKVVEAIVNAVSTGGLTESAIAQAVSDKVERAGGKLDKAMRAAQSADDQTS